MSAPSNNSHNNGGANDVDMFFMQGTPAPPPTMDELQQEDLIDFGDGNGNANTMTGNAATPAPAQPAPASQSSVVYELDEIDDDDDDPNAQFVQSGGQQQSQNFLNDDGNNGFAQGGQDSRGATPFAQSDIYDSGSSAAPPPEQPLDSSQQSYNDSQQFGFDDSRNFDQSTTSFMPDQKFNLTYADNGQPYDPPVGTELVVYDETGQPYLDEKGLPFVPQDVPIYDMDGHALLVQAVRPPPVGRVLYVETGMPYDPQEGEVIYYDEHGQPYLDEDNIPYLPLDGQPIHDMNGNPLYVEPVPPRVFYADNGEPYNPVEMIVYDQNGQPFQDEDGNYFIPDEDGVLIFDAEGHPLDVEFYGPPSGRYYPSDEDAFYDDYDAYNDMNMADDYLDAGYDDEFYEDDPDAVFRAGAAGEESRSRRHRSRKRGFFRRGRKGDDEMAPIPGETPDERRERRKRIRRQRHEAAVKRAERRRRRRRWCWLCCCICCCLLLLLLLIAAITRFWEDDPEPEPELIDDDHNNFDDDFEIFKPYEGIRTTPMDPYEEDDCFFEDQDFPHMIQQCQCLNNITIVPSDVIDLWYQVREDISQQFYEGVYDEPWWSCENSNQALIWLSSGNTRDSGDLYQRFTNAVSFVQLNGTVWDMSNYWLSDNNECLWLGIQCNGRFQMNSLAVDTNNLQYVQS